MNQSPHELELKGCAPEPLMAYLKALGIFRLVAEQKDKDARAWWRNDSFFLSSTLDYDALSGFFLNEYRPTPIVSPWNGGSGFYMDGSTAAKRAVDAIWESDSSRLEEFRQAIESSRQILDNMGIVKKPTEGEKRNLLAMCRSLMPDAAMPWLDAVQVLTTEGSNPSLQPLLGSGGNDGNLDFSSNFMKNLYPVLTGLKLDKRPSNRVNYEEIRKGWLDNALFENGRTPLTRSAIGQFNPGGAGGPNATTGFEGSAIVNPWDTVLMFEGALLFAGAATRRLSPQASSKAAFPFTVDNSAAGYGTSTDSEYGSSARGEFWAPLWSQPTNLLELNHLMSEGRAQLGKRQVSSGANFARAVAGLGTERGIAQFQRYGFLARNGLAYLAAPLGRFYVREDQGTAQRANVLFDLDVWLDNLRRQATGRNAPASLGTALRQIDQAIIEFCQRGQPRDLQNVLIALGHAERWLSTSSLRKGAYPTHPLNNLSRDWLRYADDQTAEFRLARALSSILPVEKDIQPLVGPIRENLEPVESPQRQRTEWKEGSTSFVWTAGDVLSNMLAVLERRCIEGRMNNLNYPPLDSVYSARLNDITAFLNGRVDPQRIADLVLPLSFVRHRRRPETGESFQQHTPLDLPTAYTAMKLTLLTERFNCPKFGEARDIRMEPQMLALLRAGRVKDAYHVAYRRLRASGLQPVSNTPGIVDRSEQGRRLAAALLFPLDGGSHQAFAQRALRPPSDTEAELQLAELSSDS